MIDLLDLPIKTDSMEFSDFPLKYENKYEQNKRSALA